MADPEEAMSSNEESNEEPEETLEDRIKRLAPILMAACQKNETENVLELLEQDADPLQEDAKQWTPLMWACCHGNVVLCRKLLECGAAEVYQKSGAKRHSPLHWAAFKGHVGIIWLLLLEGLSPLEKDAIGNTVLHQAAAGGSVAAVKALLAEGSDVLLKNERGHTAFDMCTNPPVKKLLKDCMKITKCEATGSGFTSSNRRFVCTYSQKVLCEDAVLRSWIFADEEAEKKEEAVTWSMDVKRMIDELEENLQVAIQEGSNAGSGGKDRKKLLEQVSAAMDAAYEKPVDVKIMKTARLLKDKLQGEIHIEEAMSTKSIITPDTEEVVPADQLLAAADNLGKCIDASKWRKCDPGMVATAKKLLRRLLSESNLTRALFAQAKLTVGYISAVEEYVATCETEGANNHLISLGKALQIRLAAERNLTLRFEAAEDLAKCKSVTEAEADPENFPQWCLDTISFQEFQASYVFHIEEAHVAKATPELIEKCEAQLVLLEDLLVEKKQVLEEATLKKKKGKKKK